MTGLTGWERGRLVRSVWAGRPRSLGASAAPLRFATEASDGGESRLRTAAEFGVRPPSMAKLPPPDVKARLPSQSHSTPESRSGERSYRGNHLSPVCRRRLHRRFRKWNRGCEGRLNLECDRLVWRSCRFRTRRLGYHRSCSPYRNRDLVNAPTIQVFV